MASHIVCFRKAKGAQPYPKDQFAPIPLPNPPIVWGMLLKNFYGGKYVSYTQTGDF
jgi:hypothetical protein